MPDALAVGASILGQGVASLVDTKDGCSFDPATLIGTADTLYNPPGIDAVTAALDPTLE